MAFGISLGATAIAFPLLALDAGFGAGVVGLLAALSAAIQTASRFALPYLLSRVPDRALIGFALAVMAASASTLLFTAAGVAFVVAQILQGLARGIFWTSSQTHMVRLPGDATRQLGFIQAFGQFGGLLGPIVAGTLASISLVAALWAALLLAVVGFILAQTLNRLATYDRRVSDSGPIWRQKGVGLGSWGSASAGAWRGVFESYVPIILESGGLGPGAIGWLMSTADGSDLAATSALAKWGRPGMGNLYVPHAALGLAAALSLLALVTPIWATAVVLILAGASGGVSGVLGAAAINDSVAPSDQGAALALVGVYRAGARSVGPAFISSVLTIVAIPVAMGIAAATLVIPAIWLRPGTDDKRNRSSDA